MGNENSSAPVDSIPILSQVKSLVQASGGDFEGATETQQNFSKGCPVVSQTRSAIEASYGDYEAATRTQKFFLGIKECREEGREGCSVSFEQKNESFAPVDAFPILSQTKSLVQACRGDVSGAKKTQENFLRGCPVVSQVRSAIESGCYGDNEAASNTQAFFIGLNLDEERQEFSQTQLNPEEEKMELPRQTRNQEIRKPQSLDTQENMLTECVVCMDSERKILCLPCRHFCLCESCANHQDMKDCPMCQSPIKGKISMNLSMTRIFGGAKKPTTHKKI